MKIDEKYFNSKEFKELLNNYENSMKAGIIPFMEVDDLVDIADYYNFNDKADEAMEVIDIALQMYPGATLPNVFMARDALTNMDFTTAHEYLDRIEDQEDPDYHYLKAEIMIAEGDADKADKYLQDYGLTVDSEEYQDFVKDCANLFVDYAMNDKAYEWIKHDNGDNSKDFKELMTRTLIGLGRFQEAEELLNDLIDNNPYSIYYWKTLASAQILKEEFADALTSSEYALAIDPDDIEALAYKANALMQLENYEESVKYYKRYLKLKPSDEMGFLHLGVCLLYLGKYHEALEALLHAESLGSDNPNNMLQIYQEQAFCYAVLGEADKALEMLDKTEDLNGDHNSFLVIKGHILMQNGRTDEAEEAWRKAIDASGYAPDVLLKVIVSLYDNRMLDTAYEALTKYCELCKENPDAPREGYCYMALCCHDLGYKKEFLEYLAISVKECPKQTKMILGYLFPPDTDVNDYCKYMTEKLSQ